MQRTSSTSFVSFGLIGLLWIAWLLVAPRAGYILGGIAFFLAILYTIHSPTRATLHDLMEWPHQPARPRWPITAVFLGALSFAWPLFSLPQPIERFAAQGTQKSSAPYAPSATTTARPSRPPTTDTPSNPSNSPNTLTPTPYPSRDRATTPNTPSISPNTPSISPSTPPQTPPTAERPRPVVQAIQQTLKQLEHFREIGVQQQRLRERIAQGDPLAKDECQQSWNALQPELNAYNKRLDKLPEEVGMHARAAGQMLSTCLGCGIPIDGKTYCEQANSFERDAKQAFKKLYD